MTELRQHLDSLRTEHRDARYPGDLAADVLGRGPLFFRRWLCGSAFAGALAAAAAIGIVLMRHPATTTPPPAHIGRGPGSVATIRPIPLGPVPVGVPIDRAPSGTLSLEFPSRPTSPAGLTLAPTFTSPAPIAPAYTDLRMPTMPTSPWSPGSGARHAPAGRRPTTTPPTSHPTRHPSQEAA
jgi:hypothetical protein